MSFYIPEPWLTFTAGFCAGWISLIALVYGATAAQRRRNRKPHE